MPRVQTYNEQGELVEEKFEGTISTEVEQYKLILRNKLEEKLQNRIGYYRLIRIALGDISAQEKQKVVNFLDALKAEYQQKAALLDSVTDWTEFDAIDFFSDIENIQEQP